ncbi:MAG: YbhB/YbcL family Raf kinase inhibitor-like protein, partial [Limisphaerales bacterium]
MIPPQYSKDGGDKSPPLHIEDVPEKTKSLVLIMDDPDAPSGTFNHWILFNISPMTKEIREDSPPVMATQGKNDYGEVGYGGPQP